MRYYQTNCNDTSRHGAARTGCSTKQSEAEAKGQQDWQTPFKQGLQSQSIQTRRT